MANPYRLYEGLLDVFEARIRILLPDEGGRKLPPYNGVRWNFRYAMGEESRHFYPLYPDFYRPETGESWQKLLPLPVNEWLFARMYCIDNASRIQVHQMFVRPGTVFYGCEGSRIIAEGTVTRLTGLFEDRQ